MDGVCNQARYGSRSGPGAESWAWRAARSRQAASGTGGPRLGRWVRMLFRQSVVAFSSTCLAAKIGAQWFMMAECMEPGSVVMLAFDPAAILLP
eukprot:3966865-Pyramimonas_sp.AAC.1